jgi:hypothetical protein
MTPFAPSETLPPVINLRPMYADRFDQLFDLGREKLLAGTHSREFPPTEGSPRYGLSVILRPDPAAADRLARIGAQAAAHAGSGHWPSGETDLVHFTVRSLEEHRAHVPDDDPMVALGADALRSISARPRSTRPSCASGCPTRAGRRRGCWRLFLCKTASL